MSVESPAAPSEFGALDAALSRGGAAELLAELQAKLRAEGRFHELFDALLLAARTRLGLPAFNLKTLDELPEPQRTQMEEAYLAACKEVGQLLLSRRQVREAWMYLRPVGDRAAVAQALRELAPFADDYEQVIEVALHEGVCPPLGFELVLEHYGVCNSITMYDSAMHQRPRHERQEVAGLLLRRVHRDLLANVQADIARQQGTAPAETTLAALVADRDWLFTSDNYHIDTSHLAAVVRFAVACTDRPTLELASDLTEYGRRLAPQFQYRQEEPFGDGYSAYGLFFAAQLGRRVDEAVEFFRQQVQAAEPARRARSAEILVALWARIGKPAEAVAAAAEWLPPGTPTSGLAPSLVELIQQTGEFERWIALAASRNDPVGYAMGLLGRSTAAGR